MSVEQAAERLRVMVARPADLFRCEEEGDSRTRGSRGVGITWNIWRDIKAVIYAYLDLFDPTPLSEEILRASGWGKIVRHDSYPLWKRIDCCFDLWNYYGEEWRIEFGGTDVASARTVGDLRRLLSALHIDCEVVVPESEAKQ